ncbi:MAG: component of oligomeric golgi complex 4 [Monoraphidium minutum]|nr:MAG: component of oligomeric golgi complex 4 [Monoraphidium minutum]
MRRAGTACARDRAHPLQRFAAPAQMPGARCRLMGRTAGARHRVAVHEQTAARACSPQDKLLCKRGELERAILLLNATTSEMLELVRADAEALLGSVQATATAADRIGGRVRRLDATQGRVQAALSLVGLILDRTSCVSGVQSAMQAGDFEAAAGYIASFLELERRLAGASGALSDDTGQVEEQRQLLLSAKAQLEGVVAARLEEAVTARDHAAVMRFIKLHKPLGNTQAGVARYLAYTRLVVGSKARDMYAALCDALDGAGGAPPGGGGAARGGKGGGGGVDFVGAMTALFRELALAAERDEKELAAAFGPLALVDVVLAVQGECDAQGLRMLQRFLEERRVAAVAGDAARHQAGVGGGRAEGPDPRAVEPLVQEVVLLIQRSEEYSAFMLAKIRAALAEHFAQQAAAAMQAAEAKYRGGAFSVSVREVVSHYMALEEYYLDATTSMAIRIDALVPDALTSSMVDDAFYILKKCGGRALATGSVQCVAALLGGLNDALANAYRGALQARLSGGPSRLVAAAPQLPGSAPAMLDAAAAAAAAEHAVAINNADVSADYAAKLRHELEAVAERVFPGVGERERVRSVLSDLSKTGGDFRSLATRALEALSDALLPRLRGVLDEVGAASYLLGDSDYLQAETEDGWVGHLLAALDLQLRWLQPRLTPGAWEGLFHSLLDKLLARLEVLLSRKQFSQLGGLQLDRDVRALVAATGEMTQRTVRDKFARLTQVATVLSLESVQEFMDYWGDDAGHVTWRLTPAEVRAVLAQRTDFAKDVIMALPL